MDDEALGNALKQAKEHFLETETASGLEPYDTEFSCLIKKLE